MTLRNRLFCLLLCLPALTLQAAGPGLPAAFDPDPALPSPAEVWGFEPGEWHPRHDQIMAYLRALAAASDRVHMDVLGQTAGQQPLPLLVFAAPERLAELDRWRDGRRQASLAGEGPVVVWLGYSVHGNEATGATAAALIAWYLAASTEAEVRDWLDHLIIVMEPVLNPDGNDRFAHWVNMHRGRHPVADPQDREHIEPWPNGRGNYYWFDLNRDWLPLVHPESRLRASALRQWRPHVLTDHHEMGPNTTYFFQPGVPERNNPLTPERNYGLTRAIAEFHARILDAAGEPYFTRELFDDYYLGKGSTYPDLTGGIGILFEQGSSRGHIQDTMYGPRRFADGVANQVRTSLSTLQAARALEAELKDYQREFFASARRDARQAREAGWLLGDGGDPLRAALLVELLLAHGIEIRPVTEPVTIAGRRHERGQAWAIAADQEHYRFLRSVFEVVTEPPMETFYDVSAWPLALAWHLPLESVRRLPDTGSALTRVPDFAPAPVAATAVAWLLPWDQYRAPAVLAALLADGYRVQVAADPLSASTDNGSRRLVRGSLVLHPGLQPEGLKPLNERLAELSRRHQVEVLAARGGLSLSGPDLGSPSVPVVPAIRPALLVGPGLRSTHAGYIWHWFDTRLEQPLTRLDWIQLFQFELADYSHLILPDGQYELLPAAVIDRITDYVRRGGIVIAARNAAAWVETLNLDWAFATAQEAISEAPQPRPYADFVPDFARELIGGSALLMELDISHPLAWGYAEPELVVFRRGAHRLKPVLHNAYVNAGRYAAEPLAAGFLSPRNRDQLAATPALAATQHGQGQVIRMADDYLFRGYWLGSEKLFANALFFSALIRPTDMPRAED